MCTTIYNYIENSTEINNASLQVIAKNNGLVTVFNNLSPQNEYFNNKIKDINKNGIAFLLFENEDNECSCSIIDSIQKYATKKVEALSTNIFNFYSNLFKIQKNIKIYAFLSEDNIKNLDKIKILECDFNKFKENILQYYGWKTEEELKSWNYDMNTIFCISDKV